jgi:hypothetical protein
MQRRLGPNATIVERFLNRLAALEFEQISTVVLTWRERLRRTDGWYAAEDAVGDAIAKTRRHDGQWYLQGQIYEMFRNSSWYTQAKPASAVAGTEAAAQYLASTAAFALLVSDVLSPTELGVLYAPYGAVIPIGELGLPELYSVRRPPPSRPPDVAGDAQL